MMSKRKISQGIKESRHQIAEAQVIIGDLQTKVNELDPVIDIGREVIAAYQSNPAYWGRDLPVAVVFKIERYLQVHANEGSAQ